MKFQFQYIGCGVEDPQTTVFYGHDFKLNGPYVEVTGELALQKILTNPTFALRVQKQDAANSREESPESEMVGPKPKIGRPKKAK